MSEQEYNKLQFMEKLAEDRLVGIQALSSKFTDMNILILDLIKEVNKKKCTYDEIVSKLEEIQTYTSNSPISHDFKKLKSNYNEKPTKELS